MKHFYPIFIFVFILSACTSSNIPAPMENIPPGQIIFLEGAVEEKPEPVVTRPQKHTIKKGETLHEIALNYGLEYRVLALWNGIKEPDKIYPGQVLSLQKSEDSPQAFIVKKQRLKEESIIATAPIDSTVLDEGRQDTDEKKALLPVNVPLKKYPKATKHAYSSKTLKKMLSEWRVQKTQTGKIKQPPTTPKLAAATATKVTNNVRRRFGIDWSWPTTGKIQSKFNERSKGLDIGGTLGLPIHASADGKVVYVGAGVKSYGRLVIIKHNNDYLSAYAHNQEILVKEGQVIKRGQKISTLGNSGTSKPMLHFEVRKAGKPFDPLQVLPSKK